MLLLPLLSLREIESKLVIEAADVYCTFTRRRHQQQQRLSLVFEERKPLRVCVYACVKRVILLCAALGEIRREEAGLVRVHRPQEVVLGWVRWLGIVFGAVIDLVGCAVMMGILFSYWVEIFLRR